MEEFKKQLDAVIENLRNEIASLRTGRATPALVDDLEIDYYGVKTPLKAIAAISVVEPRQLFIQPWDKNAVPAIEKAIQHSSLGLAPIADRDAIRLSIPPLTEERRKELVKLLGKYVETGRIKVRQQREELMREIERAQKAGEIAEDQKFRQRAEAQKIVDALNDRIEDISQSKEKEIMSV